MSIYRHFVIYHCRLCKQNYAVIGMLIISHLILALLNRFLFFSLKTKSNSMFSLKFIYNYDIIKLTNNQL